MPIPIAALERDAPVDFGREIAPILARKCLACHSASTAESELVLESADSMLKGGSSGPVVVPGKSGESRLLALAAHQAEPIMPPEDNDAGARPLTSEELGLVKLWIDQGARQDAVEKQTESIAWQPLPAGYQPILAVALSPDGQYAACSRGNQLHVYHLGAGRLVARLTDPALVSAGLCPPSGAADVDLIQSLAFHPDGRTLASGGYRSVRLWRRQPGARQAALAATPSAPRAVAVSPDGLRAAIAGEESGRPVVRLFTLPEASPGAALTGHEGEITGVRFSADGQHVFSAARDGSLRVWRSGDGAELAKVEAGTPLVGLALAADGKQLAAGGEDGKVRLWAVPDNPAELAAHAPRELTGHSQAVGGVAFAGPGRLVSSSADGSARLWDLAGGQQVRQWNHDAPVVAVAAAPDGSRLATATAAGRVQLWAPDRDEPLAELARESSATRRAVSAERLLAAVSARAERRQAAAEQAEKDLAARQEAEKKAAEALAQAEKTLAEKVAAHTAAKAAKEEADKAKSESADTAAKMLDDAAKAEATAQAAHKEAVRAAEDARLETSRAMAALPEAKVAATAAAEERTAHAAQAQAARETAAADVAAFVSLAFSPDGRTLVGTDARGACESWDSEQGAWLDRLTEPGQAPARAAFVGPNKLLLAGASAEVREVESHWALVHSIGHLDDPAMLVDRVTALAYSPDGRLLATAGGEPSRAGELKLWNAADGALVRSLPEAHSDVICGVSFSPDGRYLATGAADRLAKVFEVASGRLVRTLEGHTHHVLGTHWRANLAALATSSGDGSVKLWNAETGEQLRTLGGFGKEVTGVRFVADGPLCVAASGDATVRLFNADSGNQDRRFDGSPDFVQAMDLSFDGALVAAGGQDGVLRVWKVGDGAALRAFEPPSEREP